MTSQQILATPNISAKQGVFTFYGKAEVDASPEDVWQLILSRSSYAQWNQYTPTIDPKTDSGDDDKLELDTDYTLQYRMTLSAKLAPIPIRLVKRDDEAKIICWSASVMPSFLLRAEKVQQVTPVQQSEGKTTSIYEVWETQAGPMAHVVKSMYQSKLQAMNEGVAKGLKDHFASRA